jgi:hypothetical protein
MMCVVDKLILNMLIRRLRIVSLFSTYPGISVDIKQEDDREMSQDGCSWPRNHVLANQTFAETIEFSVERIGTFPGTCRKSKIQ